jgi:dTDP-4-amino-4,6-dideoxygalactose transaminase
MSTHKLALLGGEPVRQRPFSSWPQYSKSDIERLVRVAESRHWGGFPLPTPLAAEFSERFASLHGAGYAQCITNGTVAISAALQALGVGFGDEVIVPAYTWDGTATAALSIGAVPIFVDVDPDTYCLDVTKVRAAITPRTKAVVPVHLAMRFTDMTALLAIAREHKLIVVEDCAHAHGGEFQGRGAGAAGDAGTFSFQESKLMTGGEGGIVITSRLDCYEALQTIVNCGRKSMTDQHKLRMLGLNYRMTDLQIALLLGQLDTLAELRERRTRNARKLSEALAGIPNVRPLPDQPGIAKQTIYHYVFQFRATGPAPGRDLFVAALDAEGVPADGRFYEPVYRSDLFYATPQNCPQLTIKRDRPLDYSSFHCPVSERAAYHESVWLPQFLLIGEDQDVQDVANAVAKVVSNLEILAKADPKLAGNKALSRADRPRIERKKNY